VDTGNTSATSTWLPTKIAAPPAIRLPSPSCAGGGDDVHFVHRVDVCAAPPEVFVADLEPVPGTGLEDDGYSRIWYLYHAKKFTNTRGKLSGHRQRKVTCGCGTSWHSEIRRKDVQGSGGGTFCTFSYAARRSRWLIRRGAWWNTVGFSITNHTFMRWLILTGFRIRCKTRTEHAETMENCRLTELFYSDMFDQYMADTNGPSSFTRFSDKLLIPVARTHTMTG